MDFADSTTNATTPFSFPVMTETCGDAFNKYATIPFSAKENHEVGRLVDVRILSFAELNLVLFP